MSSFPPPSVYFNGIIYDSAYFTQSSGSGSGLTISQANARYLQKTTTDTATALETFSAGIKTNTITALFGAINAYNSTGGGATLVLDTLNANIVQGLSYLSATQIGCNAYAATSGSANVVFGSNLTFGTATLGVNACNSYVNGSNISIVPTVSLSMGNNLKPTSLTGNTITIGDQFTTNYMDNIDTAHGTNDSAIFNSLITGALSIGQNMFNGNISIGSRYLRSGETLIQSGDNGQGDVRILDGLYTGSTIGNFNVMTGNTFPSFGMIKGNINFQTGTSRGTVNIGNSTSNLVVNCPAKLASIAALASATELTVNSPLKPNYSYPVTTLSIGELLTQTPSNTSLLSTPTVLASLSLTAGVWILNGSFKCAVTTAASYTWACITTSTTVMSANGATCHQHPSTFVPPILNTTLFVSINTTTTYNLLGETANPQTVTSIYLSAVRVA